jgi:hypothetical protein
VCVLGAVRSRVEVLEACGLLLLGDGFARGILRRAVGEPQTRRRRRARSEWAFWPFGGCGWGVLCAVSLCAHLPWAVVVQRPRVGWTGLQPCLRVWCPGGRTVVDGWMRCVSCRRGAGGGRIVPSQVAVLVVAWSLTRVNLTGPGSLTAGPR